MQLAKHAQHAQLGKSAIERGDKAVSDPPSLTNTNVPMSLEKKISSQAKKQVYTGKQVSKRRLRGLHFHKATNAIEMPTQKSTEKSIAKSIEKKERQGSDASANLYERSENYGGVPAVRLVPSQTFVGVRSGQE
jgi:hypothetical protein